MYNTMHYANNNTTDYLVRFCNAQKANKACNGILIKRDVQEYGMKNIFPFHNTRFDSLQKDDKEETEKTVE